MCLAGGRAGAYRRDGVQSSWPDGGVIIGWSGRGTYACGRIKKHELRCGRRTMGAVFGSRSGGSGMAAVGFAAGVNPRTTTWIVGVVGARGGNGLGREYARGRVRGACAWQGTRTVWGACVG